MDPQRSEVPVALTVAGSDSGGGAGIQADLKTFAALGVHGASAITCLTAQNPRAVTRMEPCSPRMLRAQLEAVFAELPPAALKTGMLYSAALVKEVASVLRESRRMPVVVDPVMIATSGAVLLPPAGVRAMCRELLPLAALVTPNIPEAERLIGGRIRSLDDRRAAARQISREFGCAALVKGGHDRGSAEAVDFLCDEEGEWMFSAPRVALRGTHGTGCVYSAAITAFLARGFSLARAVELAKHHITQALAGARRVKGRAALWNPTASGHR